MKKLFYLLALATVIALPLSAIAAYTIPVQGVAYLTGATFGASSSLPYGSKVRRLKLVNPSASKTYRLLTSSDSATTSSTNKVWEHVTGSTVYPPLTEAVDITVPSAGSLYFDSPDGSGTLFIYYGN